MLPSRAIVTVSSRGDGENRAVVVARVERAADAIRSSVSDVDPADWSSGSVRSWTERPWNADGHRLPLVVHAVVEFELRLERSAASGIVAQLLTLDDVTIDGVEWTVEPSELRDAMQDLRRRAVDDAIEKARVYADTLGLSAPEVSAVADAGMLDGGTGTPSSPPGMMRAMSAPASAGVALDPSPIEIEAAVDLRFTAETSR